MTHFLGNDPRIETCDLCQNEGYIRKYLSPPETVKCSACNGKGRIRRRLTPVGKLHIYREDTCKECGGGGIEAWIYPNDSGEEMKCKCTREDLE